jgi:hypothetical protein
MTGTIVLGSIAGEYWSSFADFKVGRRPALSTVKLQKVMLARR